MLSFKHFLQDQDDNIEQEEAVKRYNEYKIEFKRGQIAEFFSAHKDEDWLVTKIFLLNQVIIFNIFSIKSSNTRYGNTSHFNRFNSNSRHNLTTFRNIPFN